MVMPFGVKPTGIADGSAPPEIDFDRLWEKVLRPAIAELDYEAVRADEDLGALIIKDMLERLTLADLVVADLTIPNGNVYYEIGIRHGTNKPGCVLVSADWSKTLFDAAQMRQIRYRLPQKSISDDDARAAIDVLKSGIASLKDSGQPLDEIGYPNLDPKRSVAFRNFIESLSRFQALVTAARAAEGEDRRRRIEDLLASHGTGKSIIPAIAIELLNLTYDNFPFDRSIAFIDSLPEAIRRIPLVKERRALAQSKVGDHLAAIGELQSLIAMAGDSSERQGLLGGRYKKLAYEAEEANDANARHRYLDKAIEHYERGMMLDLNDFFPASNLPVLLKTRAAPGDAERASAINNLVKIACEAVAMRKTDNEWTKATLLCAAFCEGDVDTAKSLAAAIQREAPAVWKHKTTMETLERIVGLTTDDRIKSGLNEIITRFRNIPAG
jgi:tetratricopeptide (TPR) repeat protein